MDDSAVMYLMQNDVVGKYFKGKNERTLEDLQSNLKPEEIRTIIYSPLFIDINKRHDDKIYFIYHKPKLRVLLRARKNRLRWGLKYNISVNKFLNLKDGRAIHIPIKLEEIEDLKQYI